MAHTQLSSCEPPTDRRPESSNGEPHSPPCATDDPSPSKTGGGRGDWMMMHPEEKLKHYHNRAQNRQNNEKFDACIQDLVRCVALTRLVYGDGHLKLAHIHARLAKAYSQFKGWGMQAQEHAAMARELLRGCSSISSCRGEKNKVTMCLLSIHLTQGGAAMLTSSIGEAESSFLEAERVLNDLQQHRAINQQEEMRTSLEISTSLCRVYRKQNRPEEALSQCERSLQLLKECDKPEKCCTVYRDMAAIEQDRGHMDQAIEHLSKAHAIAMSQSPEELESAQISHSLALILCAAAELHHNESAGHYFEQSLSAYKNCAGPQDPAYLHAQDDFCRFLLLNGQQERCVDIQRASLASKKSTYGDLSAEVADTLQLIGSVEMTEGRVMQAHRTMSKCLRIQSWMYGPQHKKTKATQKAVDMLARAPRVAEKLQRQGTGKT